MSEHKPLPEVVPWVREFFRCQKWLEEALASGGPQMFTLKEVFNEILDGRAFLWAGQRSCLVVRLMETAAGRVGHAWLAAGDLEELRSMQENVEDWGRRQGVRYVLMTGRRGWLRVFRDTGYREMHTTLVKEL